MARSTKTKHVMNLVGVQPVKKPPAHPPKPAAAENTDKAPTVPKVLEPHEVPKAQPQTPPQTVHVRQEEAVQEEKQQENTPAAEENEPVCKTRITAIVCELVNQELGSVAERFHLRLTDGNLWELTRAALEEVRPEFSADSRDTEKKLEKLRPQVIAAMTKAAIKVSAKGRNNI